MREIKQPLILLEGVRKVFQTTHVETHALSDVDPSIYPGEFVSISGPSGCGKTTLLSILGLLDEPSEGKYLLKQEDVSRLPRSEKARIRNQEIGFIFQAFNLIGDLSVYDNLELPLYYGGVSPKECRKRIMDALDRVGMAHRADHYPAQLSGGQQQRAAVARALVGEPSILLADEPTGNLDSHNGETVMSLLDKLHEEGVTICMVTHDPRWADHASRNIGLLDGRIATEEISSAATQGHLVGLTVEA